MNIAGKKKIIILLTLGIILFVLHSTPHMALRTHVFIMGYPKAALTSEIVDDVYHNKADEQKFAEMNAKAYTLTKPPVEKATQGILSNFLVKRIWFFFTAEYYGDA
ncbi:hypothetical protein GJU40_11305 [Bacillus lacus]|uniref:Uncharacterized protein n=1 Tax=Metabacillus lacus TaxID=1983721 RepID=A0A7X2IZN8_9BACI|nr:hypothetical protein [Metabacillus lacus]MRX72736.1 hypothetical protein [Metabacillus lacus]